jgi:hypothetical protein
MTRSMDGLYGCEYKVLATIRRLIPDGQRRKVSQADIARRANVSPSTVSETVRKIDRVFIRLHFVGKGRGGGYEIEVISPIGPLPTEPSAPKKPSLSEDCNRSFSSGVATPQTPEEKTSLSDHSIFLDHAHEQQQTAAPSTGAGSDESGQADQLAPETITALAEAGAHPKLIQRVAAANPGCSPADVAAALAGAHAKPTAHTPPGLALECLANRQPVITPRLIAPPRPRGRAAPDAGIDVGQARAWIARHGGAASPPPGEVAPPPARASPPPGLTSLWHAAQATLKAKTDSGAYDFWLRPLRLLSLADGVATLAAPSLDVASVAQTRYGRAIRDALGSFAGGLVRVQVIYASPAAD